MGIGKAKERVRIVGTIPYKNKAGQRRPGITTLLSSQCAWGSRGLHWWWNDQGLKGRNMQEAQAEVTIPGIIAHLMLEAYWKNESPNLSEFSKEDIDKAENSFVNFLHWVDSNKIVPIEIEPHLFSEKYQVGGTPDLIAESVHGLVVVDYKTGRIYDSSLLQFHFYTLVWEENHPDRLLTGGIYGLRIPRDQEVPSFHHSYWAKLPKEATEAIEYLIGLKRCQGVLKKLL